MDLQGLMNDMKLKIASDRIAKEIDAIKALGITKEQILEGLCRQVEHQYKEVSADV